MRSKAEARIELEATKVRFTAAGQNAAMSIDKIEEKLADKEEPWDAVRQKPLRERFYV